ncbi:MAG: DNA mismatch repair endonuclease MutL [Clostridia bacterium]|nr:DNA mismatch repair endonuclease MutL [Clostridia bacterium]
MSVINVLDAQTANLIAAGEVVDRPASVVKELMENSIDAGAKKITVEIKKGGSELIRVTDDGCGMSREDAALCVKRHATSKVKGPEDLDGISTLGFRGEALAAISSVSLFGIITKRREDQIGTKFETQGGEIIYFDDFGCPDGTTVTVKELFKNQPARQKFLKRDSTESSAVTQFFSRIAVSHPGIAFTLIIDGHNKMQTTGDSDLKKAIYCVYGKDFSDSLIKLDYVSDNGIKVGGFITGADASRPNRSNQSFYINSRFVKSKTMLFALEDAYKSYVKSDRFPGCVLMLDADFSSVDVNVHPAKLEVRFSDERAVYNAVYFAVKNALSGQRSPLVETAAGSTPAVDEFINKQAVKSRSFDFEIAVPKIAPYKPKSSMISLSQPTRSELESRLDNGELTRHDQQILKETRFLEDKKPSAPIEIAPKKSPENPPAARDNSPGSYRKEEAPGSLPGFTSGGKIIGVAFDAFIIYQSADSLFFIDKHAAHERIIYERLKNEAKEEAVQLLVEPVSARLDPVQMEEVMSKTDELKTVGFIVEEFGPDSVILRGVPLSLSKFSTKQIREIFENTASDIAEGARTGARKEYAADRILYTAACKAAVKAGIPDSDAEYKKIVDDLISLENVLVCPHGRPVVTKITHKQLEKLFLRD